MMSVLPFILKHWKLAAIIALTIYIITLNISLDYFKSENARNSADLKVVTGVVTGEGIKTKFYKNKLEQQVAKTETQYVTKETLANLLMANDKQWKLRFDAKPKQVESATNTLAIISDDGITMLPKDSIECEDVKYFEWFLRDEYNDIYAIVTDTPQFEVRVPLYELEVWQRKKILGLRIGKKEWFKEITTPNKLVKLNSQVIYTIRKKKE